MSGQRLLLVVVGLAVLWFGYRRLFPDDEARIRAVLEQIADAVGSGAGDESDVSRLARAGSMRNHLEPQITVDAGPPFSRMIGRDTIVGTVARLRGSVDDLEVEFDDVQVAIGPDHTTARVYLTAEARYRDGSGARGLEARELDLTFRKLEDKWVVASIALVRTLEPLTPQ